MWTSQEAGNLPPASNGPLSAAGGAEKGAADIRSRRKALAWMLTRRVSARGAVFGDHVDGVAAVGAEQVE